MFKQKATLSLIAASLIIGSISSSQAQVVGAGRNPVIYADVPDISMIRVGDTYYMSSTTMYFNPGVPIMKSKDLVNWEIVNYCYDTLDTSERQTLSNGKNDYGRGTWASSIRFHKGVYYVSTFSLTTGKTYIYSTPDIEKGPWKTTILPRALHDHTLVFDDDGRVYMIYGGGTLRIIELLPDLSGFKPGGVDQVLIQEPSAVTNTPMGLKAEGSQLIKHEGKYYIFNICWPRGGMRTVLVHRADNILGPWEGKVAFQDKGVAQGSIIDTADGKWYAYLFRDFGAVGRIPYMVPATWKDGWPVIGVDGKAPDVLEGTPTNKSLIPGIVAADEFDRKTGDRPLPLVWQWNHNSADSLWSLTERSGFLRLKTDRVDSSFYNVRNMLTQRTFGPECSGTAALDVSGMKDGDFAGLSLLQKRYGMVGVKMEGGTKRLVMAGSEADTPVEVQSVPLDGASTVYLKAECDFKNRSDTGRFLYSLDGNSWKPIGEPIKMTYQLAHFTGYRFALFYYSTQNPGGHVDFDYFRPNDKLSSSN